MVRLLICRRSFWWRVQTAMLLFNVTVVVDWNHFWLRWHHTLDRLVWLCRNTNGKTKALFHNALTPLQATSDSTTSSTLQNLLHPLVSLSKRQRSFQGRSALTRQRRCRFEGAYSHQGYWHYEIYHTCKGSYSVESVIWTILTIPQCSLFHDR